MQTVSGNIMDTNKFIEGNTELAIFITSLAGNTTVLYTSGGDREGLSPRLMKSPLRLAVQIAKVVCVNLMHVGGLQVPFYFI